MPKSAGSSRRKMTMPETNERARSPSWVPKLRRRPERTAARSRSSPSPGPSPDVGPDPGPDASTPVSGDVTQQPARRGDRGGPAHGSGGLADIADVAGLGVRPDAGPTTSRGGRRAGPVGQGRSALGGA